MHTDPIADMLTRIRNAQAVRKAHVTLPFSKFKYQLAQLLVAEKWIESAERISREKGDGAFDELKLSLKYSKSGKPAIMNLKRISTPGRRLYTNYQSAPYVLNGFGMAVISTSRGLMTDKQARKEHVGGEIICEVY